MDTIGLSVFLVFVGVVVVLLFDFVVPFAPYSIGWVASAAVCGMVSCVIWIWVAEPWIARIIRRRLRDLKGQRNFQDRL